MSTLSVTNINTANGTTDLTIRTGNSSSGGIIVQANGAGIIFQGNSSANIMVVNNTVVSYLGTQQINASSLTVTSNAFIANTTGVYTTGTVNAASHTVGTSFIANSTQVTLAAGVGLSANGGLGTSGQVLTSNASSIYWAAAGGSNVQTFAVSGTWTKPASGTIAVVQCWGGGGSGGSYGGGGGGGGGYNEKVFLLSTLGATETVTVGTGGVASNSSNSGSSGGTTTFGSWVSAFGGSGGNGAGGSVSSSTGGAGGNPFAAPLSVNPLTSNPIWKSVYAVSACVTVYPPCGLIGGGAGVVVFSFSGGIVRDITDGAGINGYGGGGGGQINTASYNIITNTAYSAAGGAGTYWGYEMGSKPARGNGGFSVDAGGGGGAGRNTGAVYAGGAGVGNGGAGANATTAATGGSVPGGGGGGGSDSASNRTSGAGANGQCIVIVI